jgi:Flp pilus assembly pilin Flp
MSRIPFRRRSSELRAAAVEASGQSLAEYAVIIAAIAVACMIAVLFLVAGIRDRFDSTDQPSPQAPFVPPPSPALSYPTTLEDCEDGGWKNYAQFRDEAQCKKYVKEHTP